MNSLLTIPHDFVKPLAYLLLIIPLVVSFLLYWISKRGNSSKINRFVSKYIIQPLPLDPLHPEISEYSSDPKMRSKFTQQLSYRLILIYGGIFLFILGNLIGEFYLLFADLSQSITQGTTGSQRVWSNIVFSSPFNGGWMGFFPWYGGMPLPPINLDSYHDPWSWILFTASSTDNPAFVDDMVWRVLLGSILSGFVFLTPLVFSFIRKSFLPSMFFFFTGMLTSMKAIFSCFGQAFKLEFTSGSITYGIKTITKKDLMSITDLLGSFILPLLFISIVFFLLFSFLGNKIWRSHYSEQSGSHNWFRLFLTLSYWGSLIILLV
jgi:hypothetical protein